METHCKPYQIFIKDGIRIGVFGLGIELQGLVDKKNYKETKYLDPVETSQEMTRILKEQEGCDLVICLSHLGYFYKSSPERISDLVLARSTKDIHAIIGGHTHTFLPKPTIEKNLNNDNVLVNQVGCYGLYLGQLNFYFEKAELKKSEGVSIIV